MNWLIFSLAAITLWSIAAIIEKFIRLNHIKNALTFIILVLPVSFFPLSFLFLEPFRLQSASQALIALSSGIFSLAAFYLYLKAVQNEEITKSITAYAAQPLFVLFIAIFFLGESLSLREIAAFLVIMISISIIGFKKTKEGFHFKKDIVLLLFSAFFFAVQAVLFKLIGLNFATLMILREIPFFTIPAMMLLSKKVRYRAIADFRKIGKKRYSLMILSGIVGTLGVLFLYLGVQSGPVSLVSLIEGSQCIITMAFATVLTFFYPDLIKEDISKKALIIKAASIILMVSGVYLLVV